MISTLRARHLKTARPPRDRVGKRPAIGSSTASATVAGCHP
ncbi:hypothetical protein RESH_05340 [Rhodopirellula europaea SH398]|uniref:Uncharacterized protein n=2 Tax=Rhodopirellula europaea TaxID=1263866 RepID=M5SDB8_9BACT|nr:hypothetical protein RE6C_01084 [Rhodopirellula europaea 6C]EMI24129.1 hypothetical protein RESH_05340 [Rhodopirellula europaea SH398]